MKYLLAVCLLWSSTILAADHKFGWKSNPYHSKGLRQFSSTGLTKINPKSDLRAGLPPIYDQGQLGSCTANAGLAAFEFAWNQKHHAFLSGSRLGLYTFSLKRDGSWPNDAGSYTSTVVYVLKNNGVGLEKCFPYKERTFGVEPPACYVKTMGNQKLIESYDVDNTDGKSIRAALTAGLPVMFGGYVYQDIMNLPATGILPSPRGRPVGGHEMLVVGHDDAKQLYTVRNSWGTVYGVRGHLYIKYADLHNKRIYEDFAALKLSN